MAPESADAQDGGVEVVSWEDFYKIVGILDEKVIKKSLPTPIYGIPTGGCFISMELHRRGHEFAPIFNKDTIIVDDIIDSGKTMQPYLDDGYQCFALYASTRYQGPVQVVRRALVDWVHFPWEHSPAPEDAVIRLLEYLGEDPRREGLVKTPARVLSALKEMTSGRTVDTKALLTSAIFKETHHYDQIVLVKDITFNSLCEHHMLPFSGVAHVAYIPGDTGAVVGVSKVVRLVEAHAQRLQIQERMTEDIASDLSVALEADGVAVVITAAHQCMRCRGVRNASSKMTTSAVYGSFRDDASARAEFLRLIK